MREMAMPNCRLTSRSTLDPSYSRSRIWLAAVKKWLLTSPDPTFHNEDLQEVECEGVLERIER